MESADCATQISGITARSHSAEDTRRPGGAQTDLYSQATRIFRRFRWRSATCAFRRVMQFVNLVADKTEAWTLFSYTEHVRFLRFTPITGKEYPSW